MVIGGVGAVITAALAVPGVAYLFKEQSGARGGSFVEAADLSQLQIGKPHEVMFDRTRVDGWRTVREKVIAWVVRKDETNVVAYSAQCTHLGCAYHWEDKRNQFVCPCHTSLFSIDGQVQGGPAPRPLDRYAVRIEDGKLLIGTQIQRSV